MYTCTECSIYLPPDQVDREAMYGSGNPIPVPVCPDCGGPVCEVDAEYGEPVA